MSTHKTIAEKIDAVFAAHGKDKAEELRSYVAQLQESYALCKRIEGRNFVLLLLAWIAAVMVAHGAVSEVQVTSVKLQNVKLLVLLAAPAIGYFGHNLIAVFMHSKLVSDAISQSYKHTLPTVFELDLELLAAPPSFADVVRVSFRPARGSLLEWYGVLVGLFVLLLPGAALGHLAYLAYHDPVAPLWLTLCSFSAGIVLWLHGLALFVGVVTVSEG